MLMFFFYLVVVLLRFLRGTRDNGSSTSLVQRVEIQNKFLVDWQLTSKHLYHQSHCPYKKNKNNIVFLMLNKYITEILAFIYFLQQE